MPVGGFAGGPGAKIGAMTTKSKAPIGTKNNIIPIRATNLATGEVSELGIAAPKSRRRKITGYYSLYPGAMRKLKASPVEVALIHLLLERQDSRNSGVSHITQREMAEELGSQLKYIQRVLSVMQKRHIVYREGQGRYRVNSHIGFQGSSAAWEYAWVADRDPDWLGIRTKLEAL